MTILDAMMLIMAGGAAVSLAWVLLSPRGRRAPAPPPAPAPVADDLRVTPLDRLGPALVRTAGDQLYGRLLGDPRLRYHVSHLNQYELDRLRQQVGALIAQVLGGPAIVEMHHLTRLYHDLGASHDTYWAAAGHLVSVLAGLRAPTDITLHVVGVLLDAQRVIEQAGRAQAAAMGANPATSVPRGARA